jgi:hypothetical protein
MKRNLILGTVLMLLFTFSACEKSKLNDLSVIKYGSSFGMCVGFCVNELAVGKDEMTYSGKQRSPKPDTRSCTKPINADEVEAIKELIDIEKIAALPEVIGCPDCADGGAEWVAINAGGKNYKITFEYGKAPKELAAAVARLKILTAEFKDCK